MVKNLILDKEENTLKWTSDENQISFFVEDLDSAMLDEKRGMIFALSRTAPLPTLLTILNDDGALLATLSPPDGAYFYYLTRDDTKEVLVICSFSEKKSGWYDWHYSFEQSDGSLVRKAPSY
ncbi:hypothetical protein PYR66_13900 [Klebsiella aerogenes]|nr:hypothetical protein PYR66_13900 [Klebsiella aerogenes]